MTKPNKEETYSKDEFLAKLIQAGGELPPGNLLFLSGLFLGVMMANRVHRLTERQCYEIVETYNKVMSNTQAAIER